MLGRRGFTLIEMVVAMTLTMLVFAITLPFVRAQTRALGDNAGRLDSEQTARYAQRIIDKDLRLAVSDVSQPLIVYAGRLGIAFNANLIARDTLDPSALELNTTADSTLAEAWRVGQASNIPLTSRSYPTVTYADAGGTASRNETVMYFLRADTVSGRSDIYVLYRRVNGRDSTQIVRNIHVPADSAFFTYYTMSSGVLSALAASSLPLFWDSTQASKIRAVRIRAGGFYRNAQTREDVIRTIYWTVMLSNRTGFGRDCGAAPSVPPANSNADFAVTWRSGPPPRVEVKFSRSADDGGGSRDVTHYLIDRQLSTAMVWTTVATVPATAATVYRWSDVFPPFTSGVAVSYNYGVRAVDCSGRISTRATRSSVNVPQ